MLLSQLREHRMAGADMGNAFTEKIPRLCPKAISTDLWGAMFLLTSSMGLCNYRQSEEEHYFILKLYLSSHCQKGEMTL